MDTILQKSIIVIGAGISGSTIARCFADAGYQVTIFEKESIGGNCFDYFNKYGILVQKYGPHIFHTDDVDVYKFITKFGKFNHFNLDVYAHIANKLVSMPINFHSIDILYDKQKSDLIKKTLLKNWPLQKSVSIYELVQCNDELIKSFAMYIFDNVYRNYSFKMWNIPIEKLDPDIINRVKINLNYEKNYFPKDKYQIMPINGFTSIVKNILNHRNIKLILQQPKIHITKNDVQINGHQVKSHVFYCGSIDELFNYRFGYLPYRSLNIEFNDIRKDSFQEYMVINYPGHKTMTRITEYKKLNKNKVKNITTISKEFPGEFNKDDRIFNKRYYPIKTTNNIALYNKYFELLSNVKNFHLLGRLAQYKYYDMDDAIKSALNLFKQLNEKN